jgi:hypothetical protein
LVNFHKKVKSLIFAILAIVFWFVVLSKNTIGSPITNMKIHNMSLQMSLVLHSLETSSIEYSLLGQHCRIIEILEIMIVIVLFKTLLEIHCTDKIFPAY